MKSLLIGVLAACVLSVAATAASANGLCVGASDYCAAGAEFPLSAEGLQNAVDAAQSVSYPGEDFIYVAPGEIDLGATRINVDPPTNQALTIIGSGVDKTIFHSTTPDDSAFRLYGSNADVGLSDATIKVDGLQTTGRRAVDASDADIARVKFEVAAADQFTTDGFSGGGNCRDCEFSLTGNNAEAGYVGGNANFYSAKVYSVGDPTGTVGFRNGGGGVLQVFTSTISKVAIGMSTDNGTLVLNNSVIDMGDIAGARGMLADNANGGTQSIGAYAYSSTFVGTGDNQRSFTGDANSGESLNLYVKNSILMASAPSSKDIVCTNAGGSANLTIAFDLYYASHFTFNPDCSTTTSNPNPADSYALSDIFVDSANGDFRLKKPVGVAINPAFDTGSSGAPECDQAFDVIGNTRCVNSVTLLPDMSKIDVGAVEYQNYRPEKLVVTAPTGGRTGDSLAFSASGFDANGDPLAYNWKFGDGQVGTGSAVSHSYAAAGVYSVELRANDGTSDSDPVTASIVISASPVEPSFATLTLAKASGKFKFKKRAKLSNGFKAVAKKPKVAYVLATTSQVLSGKVTLLNSKGKTLKGSQKITLKAGRSYLTFGGKWNKKALPKGKYTLKFTSSSLKDAKKSVLSIVR